MSRVLELVSAGERCYINAVKISIFKSLVIFQGQIHSAGCCPDAPFVFAFGGEGEVKVWDIRESAAGIFIFTFD